MKAEKLKKMVPNILETFLPDLYELSNLIFQNPEIAYKEVKASNWLSSFLKENGFSVKQNVGNVKTAFKAEKITKKKGPSIAFISEYDALPELGHACGHNIIATMGVGAAAILSSLASEIPGKILSIGTPAEEGGGGKIKLLKKGVFDDVDAAMMIHPSGKNEIFRPALARVKIFFDFYGKPTHAAASPEKGINALDALVSTYQNISLLRQQLPDDVRIHGIITKGGDALNITPEHTQLVYLVRTKNKDFLPELTTKVIACAKGAAISHNAKLKSRLDSLKYDPLKRNTTMETLFKENLKALGESVEEKISDIPAGSTDFGNLSYKIPGIHPRLKMVAPNISAHTPEFEKASGGKAGKKLIALGSQVMAMTAIDLMTSNNNMKKVREDFKRQI